MLEKLKALMNWKVIRAFFIDNAEKIFVDFALKKVLGTVIGGGLKVWIVKMLATKLYSELGKPLIEYALRKGFLIYDLNQGKILYKNVTDAKAAGNEADYINNISDV